MWRNFNANWLTHCGVGDADNFERHGCGEEHGLTILWHRRKNFCNLWREAHVEHAVRFVEDENFHVIQLDGLLLQVVDQTAGSGDDDVWVLLEVLLLEVHGRATNQDDGAHTNTAANLTEVFFNLQGEFARWENNEATALKLGEALDHWNTERERFAGTGLGDTNNVRTFQCCRDRLVLNWGWRGVLVLRENVEKRWRNAKVRKAV